MERETFLFALDSVHEHTHSRFASPEMLPSYKYTGSKALLQTDLPSGLQHPDLSLTGQSYERRKQLAMTPNPVTNNAVVVQAPNR